MVLAGEYGIDGVALTVPVTLGGGGVARPEWELTADQPPALRGRRARRSARR